MSFIIPGGGYQMPSIAQRPAQSLPVYIRFERLVGEKEAELSIAQSQLDHTRATLTHFSNQSNALVARVIQIQETLYKKPTTAELIAVLGLLVLSGRDRTEAEAEVLDHMFYIKSLETEKDTNCASILNISSKITGLKSAEQALVLRVAEVQKQIAELKAHKARVTT